MESTTVRLTNVLKSKKDIKVILHENETAIAAPSLQEYLDSLLLSKGMNRQEVIRRAELDGNYINQLFNGIRTKPGRNQMLSLAFGFGLNKEETDRLLKVAKVGALYPRHKRDAIIIHSLENGKSVSEVNNLLNSFELELLVFR